MVNPLLIPVPFLALMLVALLVPNGRNRWLGYLGALASLATLALLALVWQSPVGVEQPWFAAPGTSMTLSMLVDPLSLLMAAIVAGVGVFVFWYSVGYFSAGENLRKYYALMALFALSMLAVVLAGNLFQLFFFWELVGVSSYLLIGFWQHKESAVAAARKAFTTIIIGDAFFLAGILLLYHAYGTFDISTILATLRPDTYTVLAGIGIIAAGISKSAQFPLHAWLPDAMEGPTPVSAFLHSATMVKAGLFLIARMLPLIIIAGLAPWLVLIAVITIIISACMALVENDIKRVLAYSTMNQLAFILLSFGLGAVAAGLFQLLTHSVFKALLFLSAGVLIHAAGTQDMTQMRVRRSGVVWLSALAGAAALAGLPPLSGFFSKDAIYEAVLAASPEIILVFSIAVALSAAYICRWLLLIFHEDGVETHGDWTMRFPLPVLAVLAVLGGAAGWVVLPWLGAAAPHFGIAAILSTVLVLLGAWGAYLCRSPRMQWLADSPLAGLFRERFFLDALTAGVGRAGLRLGRAAAWLDDAVVNRCVRGIASAVVAIGRFARRMQTGNALTYAAAMILGFLLLVVAVRFA